MTRYLLNAPVLTAYGRYRFEGPLPLAAAQAFAREGAASAVGHAASARWLSQVLGVDVPCRRWAVTMHPGDQALILRLAGRLPEGVVLNEAALDAARPEFGLLVRED